MKINFNLPLQKDKNILLFYIFSAVFWIYPIVPVIAIFLQSKGFSYTDIGIIVSVFMFSTIISEIPTSYIGDKFGRRNSVLTGLVIIAFITILWTQGVYLYQYLLMSVVWMFGLSFLSGTFEAYIYDYLKSKNQLEYYDGVISKSTMFTFSSYAIGFVLGLFAYSIHPYLPYFLVAGFSAISFILVSYMDNDYSVQKELSENKVTDFLSGLKVIAKSESLLWIVLFISVFYGFDHFFVNGVNVPYLQSLNILELTQIGIFLAIMSIAQSIVAAKFDWFRSKFSDDTIIIALSIMQVGALIGMAFLFGYLGLISFVFFSMIEPFEPLLINSFSQKYIESHIRATTISSIKMVGYLLTSIVGVIAGYLADQVGLKYSFFIIAMGLGVLLLGLFVVKRVKKISL